MALDPDRGFPLFRQSGVVDCEHTAAHRQDRPQALPERTSLPGGVGDEMLQTLIRPGVAQPPVHRLHRFPLAVVEQPLNVPTGVGSVRSATETAGELIEERAQPFQQRTRRRIGHASEDKKSAGFVQVKVTK